MLDLRIMLVIEESYVQRLQA